MIKQEEIIEGIRDIVLKAMGAHSVMAAHFPDTIIHYLHFQGVVIKVERELPNWCRTVGMFRKPIPITKDDILNAGYVAVEPLIKEGQ